MSDDGPFTRAERHLAELSDEIRLAATFDAMHERALAAVEQMGREMREGFIEPATVEDWIDRAVATAECFDSAEHGAIMRDVGDELARLFEPANGAQPNRRHGNGSGQEPQAIGHQFFGKSSAEFVRDFVPPDYLIDGIMQQRFLYAITGRTGSGKTAIVLLIAACVALGRSIGNRCVSKGTVFYLAGENPDDVRMRWIAMSQQMNFDLDLIDVRFYPRCKISEMRDRLMADAAAVGGVVLVVVDTSPAFYESDDPNNNAQQGEHALRLRSLSDLPGGPCVLAACHPIKNATRENLLPYGGGAFLNEIDGNLSCWMDGVAVEVHWQGKFRGPDFAPISFKVRTVTHERLKDTRSNQLHTVIAEHLNGV